jgi:Bcr/CflA subfamily drug resistance transporter
MVLLIIGLYALASLAAALAHSIVFLIIMRIVQGLGACGMMVCAFAIVRDLLVGDESAQIYSYLNGAIAISPLLAPLAGGYLDAWFGWHAPFFTLFILGAMVFAMVFYCFSETIPQKETQLSIATVFKQYGVIAKNKQFLLFTCIAASALACFFTFFSVSPYILIQTLHIPETKFGIYFGMMGLVFFLSSVAAGKLIAKVGLLRVALLGCILFFISGILMLIWTHFSGTSVISFIFPSCVCAIGGSFMMGAGAGGALEPFSAMTGTAAALLGASEFLFATLIGTIALQKQITSNYPFAITLTLFGGLSLVLMVWYQYVPFTIRNTRSGWIKQ